MALVRTDPLFVIFFPIAPQSSRVAQSLFLLIIALIPLGSSITKMQELPIRIPVHCLFPVS